MTNEGIRSNYELTKYTPYLALMGEVWGVFCEFFLVGLVGIWTFLDPIRPDSLAFQRQGKGQALMCVC